MFGFSGQYNPTITSKIRLFSAFFGKKRVYVISLIFAKKVLTKRDSICYNDQAVRETGSQTRSNETAANLENDTEKREKSAKRTATRPGREER